MIKILFNLNYTARLDHGSDEKMADLKIQLKETHEELEEAREELTQKSDLLKTTKNEVCGKYQIVDCTDSYMYE